MLKNIYVLLFCALGNLTLLPAASLPQAGKPNVILILADDLGAEGLGCYGSSIYTTPHLDRLAAEGVRFNNSYATPLCTPTRVMLMSGLYPPRTGFNKLLSKDDGVHMPASIKTFGSYFRDAGYKTAIAGKWQLGKFDENPQQPVENGFDSYCMWTWVYKDIKASRYYSPLNYQDGKVIHGTEKDFGPDIYNRYLLDFIDHNKDKPFFIYYPMVLVHDPLVVPPSLAELAHGKYTDDLNANTKKFGHMVTYMDYLVGEIINRLKKHSLEKNTIVIFTGDNGTFKSITSKISGLSIKGGKGTMTEAGTRVPLIAWWPDKISPAVRDEFFCSADMLPTITSVAGIPLDRAVDGMDLSHLFYGKAGAEREHVMMNLGSGFYVRDHRFRLNEDGKMYDIATTSDATRYSEKICTDPAFQGNREKLQHLLDEFRGIKSEYSQEKTKNKK